MTDNTVEKGCNQPHPLKINPQHESIDKFSDFQSNTLEPETGHQESASNLIEAVMWLHMQTSDFIIITTQIVSYTQLFYSGSIQLDDAMRKQFSWCVDSDLLVPAHSCSLISLTNLHQ